MIGFYPEYPLSCLPIPPDRCHIRNLWNYFLMSTRRKTGEFCMGIPPSGHFARLYQFLVREPPSLPVFDTKLVGSFFTPSGQKAPVTRGFPGDFAELYGSDNASLYRRSGADCKSRCLRRSILPRLSISPNCVDTIWRNVFSRNRFGISPNRLPPMPFA